MGTGIFACKRSCFTFNNLAFIQNIADAEHNRYAIRVTTDGKLPPSESYS
jgi:hypothetical protein